MATTPLLILCDNHMDVIWRRGCRQHYCSVDGIIRPYSDLEEEQIRRAIHLAETSGCRYTLEQSLPLKLFLERNPDLLPVVRRLVGEGLLELPGGGETLIDLNMVCGESLVRNHLYSILWCERLFGRRSQTANGADLFGYSAQFPQVLRLLGYETLANSSRLFDDGTPFWRGLDGSTVLVRPTWENLGLPQVHAGGGCIRPPAPCCDGEGCPLCGYRGLDLSDQNVRSDETLTLLFERMQGITTGPLVLRVTGEETLEDAEALRRLVAAACEHGFAPRFVTMTELVEVIDGDRLARLGAGQLAPEEIRAGVEGNPICTGCYVSRIRLKQWNRRLEALLLAAETFAAFAWRPGDVYPRGKLEGLWNQMAVLQFHDAITGSHSDGAYEELLGVCRNIARGAHQIYEAATQAIAGTVASPGREGYRAAVVATPLPWPVDGAPIDIVLDLLPGEMPRGVEVSDSQDRAVAVTEFEPVAYAVGGKAAVRLAGLRLPPNGYGTIHYRFTQAPPARVPLSGTAIENEYYRVVFDALGVAEILDKELGEVILRSGAGGLVFEEDYGSVWETLAEPAFACSVARHSTPSLTLCTGPDLQQAVLEGEFSDRRIQHERKVARLKWRQEITLHSGVKRLYFKTTVDWATRHGRLMLQFPLAFNTPEDEAAYEIPFGVLARQRYAGQFGIHTRPNGDWPALNFVACHNAAAGYWVTIANRGTPCHRVEEGVVKMTVVRSPGVPLSSWDTQGAADAGVHVFEAMLSSAAGDLSEVNPVRLGQEFNTPFCAASLGAASDGQLPPEHSFLTHDNPSVAISAVKRAEDSDDLVARLYEPYGRPAQTGLHGLGAEAAMETDLLERNPRSAAALVFRPHEIKTVRIGDRSD